MKKLMAMLCLAGAVSAEPIEDNSFFIEEAYNQRDGEVQHIFFIPYLRTEDRRGHAWEVAGTFTQEWPLGGRTHQISYTIPGIKEHVHPDDADDEEESGFGDCQLNYRLQVMNGEKGKLAFAPRISIILPTGDREFRHDEGGLQANLPFSINTGHFSLHANLGATWFRDDHIELANGDNSHEEDLWHVNAGVSAIWNASDTINLLVEATWNWDEEIDEREFTERTSSILVTPGVRWALNYDSGTQVVFGFGVPIGVTHDAPDWGIVFYLSVEHAWKGLSRSK